MQPMDDPFLDLCERTADHARREAALRTRAARTEDEAALAEVERELEHETIEKRIALYLALDSLREPRLPAIFIPRSDD